MGLDEVIDWVADNMGSLCPSPGADTDPKRELQYEPHTQLPLHPIAWDLMDSLNEEFKKLTLDGSFKPPASLRRRYPVHSVDFLDAAAKVDDDIKLLTGSSNKSGASFKVSESSIASLETEAKRSIKTVSALASTAEAIGNNLDSPDRNVEHIQSALSWMVRGLTDVVSSFRFIWASSLAMRRRGFLAQSSWDETAKKKLLRQPVDKTLLFNESLETEQDRLAKLAQNQVVFRTIRTLQERAPRQTPK